MCFPCWVFILINKDGQDQKPRNVAHTITSFTVKFHTFSNKTQCYTCTLVYNVPNQKEKGRREKQETYRRNEPEKLGGQL